MSAVMVAPVTMVMPRGPMVADDARAMHGQHPAATSSSDKDGSRIDGGIIVGVGIVIRIIVVIDAADKSPSEVTTVTEAVTGKPRHSCEGRGRRADRAAANESTTHAANAAAAAPTTASSTTTTAAMPATDLDHQAIGNRLARTCACRIDWRHRLGRLAGEDRHHHERRGCAQ